MGSLFLAYLIICGVLPCACTLAGWLGCAWWDSRRDRPVPYMPTDAAIDALAQAVTCYWCRPQPKGRCTCGVQCGDQRCPRLSRADLDYLDHGSEMPR